MTKMMSPGVFTQEKDQGFLPQSLGEIGGALIGRSPKGPAFKPIKVTNFAEFKKQFGDVNSDYLCTYAAKDYLENAGNLTFVRVLGGGAFTFTRVGEITSGSELMAVIRPTYGNTIVEMKVTGSTPLLNDFDLWVSHSSGEVTYSDVSLTSTDSTYLGNIIGTNPKGTTYPIYLDSVYSAEVSKSIAGIDGTGELTEGNIHSVSSVSITTSGFSTADSPTVISQTFGASTNHDLFELKTLAEGTAANTEIKISISDIKPATDIPNSDYGKFTLLVREYSDTDINPVILETFSDLDLNPNSPDYIARRIGDQYTVTDSEGKITVYGDFENISEYIRVVMSSLVGVPEESVPFGFKNMKKYNSNTPDPVYLLSQSYNSEYNSKVYYGEDFTVADKNNYHTFLPSNAANASSNFLLTNCIEYVNSAYSGSLNLANTDSTKLKFSFGFQNGFDGYDPRLSVVSQSAFTTSTTSGSIEYRKAIDTVGNPEEFDINLMTTPECNHRQHSPVTSYLMDKCRDRGDALAVIDAGPRGDSINTVISTVQSIDNSYAAVYYPYLKIKDEDNNKNIWVPPSVLIPGVLAYNDSIAHEWYAPAGLTRGGLTNAIATYKRLYQSDCDKLYAARINPIKSFPTTNFPVVWGQKTLLAGTSNKKLDRVNIRRMVLKIKKLIASVTRYLVFEQNDVQTWNRFKSLVNPILFDIQKENGLYGFVVQMDDETTISATDIDRNIMPGKIFLKPTETAEYIPIEFNIMPTGATFPGE